jgi:putative tricarboxylic transport membrane protein
MDTVLNLVNEGFANIFNPQCLLLLCAGIVFGSIFGCIPGLTVNICLAVTLPITFTFSPIPAMCVLIGVYIGGISGGLISAILIGIPGTPASVATTFDGYPMTQKGEAGRALGIGVFYSFLGTLFGFFALVTVAPALASFGLKFGYFEFFALGLFALTVISSLVTGNILKGLGSAAVGMALAMVGLAPIDSALRFTFGTQSLKSGFDLLPITVGFFAVVALMETAESKGKEGNKVTVNYKIKGFGFTLKEFKDNLLNFFRSALIGLGIGILPGMGGNISNLVAYSTAKSQSKYPDKFGTGIMDGIVASETANNATIGGAILPLLTLGIPGDGSTALILGGLMVYGITPGPLMFVNQADIVYSIYALLFIGSFLMVLIVRGAMSFFVKLLDIPTHLLMPIIVLLASTGTYSSTKMISDIWVALVLGIVGYFMKLVKIPIAPLIVAFILTPMIEANLRRGLMVSPNRSFWDFFSSPIFVVFFVATILVTLYSVFDEARKAKAAKVSGVKVEEEEKD